MWVFLNTWALPRGEIIDPYPFVFLNLILSMLAAVQAPIIMMSQNRQSNKDRLAMAHDYEVNLKAELEIMDLHQKIDQIRDHHFKQLMNHQTEQIASIKNLIEKSTVDKNSVC